MLFQIFHHFIEKKIGYQIFKKSFNFEAISNRFSRKSFLKYNFLKNCYFDYVLNFNNVHLFYILSKLVFQFRKNEYKKTCNILKNCFTKSIFKNKNKNLFF